MASVMSAGESPPSHRRIVIDALPMPSNAVAREASTSSGVESSLPDDPVRRLLPLGLCLLLAAAPIHAATLGAGFTESQFGGAGANIANGTAMAFAPDGRLFVGQQAGALRIIKDGLLLTTPFVTIPVDSTGERGLLGVAFDPNFASNQYVYVYYTTASAPTHNRVSRFTANGDVAVAGSETVILDLDGLSATNHNGGAIHFGPDGKLYIAVGENAVPSNAQSLGNLLGKVLRINPDGSIPTDNPFFNQATGNNRAIWILGLRNPFTFGFQPGSGRAFINDVGQGTWEEVNDGIAGRNYGWPNCEGNCTPANPNFTNPVYQYSHDGSTCAIVGATFYNPPVRTFLPDYVGKYFIADLCANWIRYLDPSFPKKVAQFATGLSNPVDLQVGPDGALYYLQRGNGGQVWRVAFGSYAVIQGRNDFDGDGATDFAGLATRGRQLVRGAQLGWPDHHAAMGPSRRCAGAGGLRQRWQDRLRGLAASDRRVACDPERQRPDGGATVGFAGRRAGARRLRR